MHSITPFKYFSVKQWEVLQNFTRYGTECSSLTLNQNFNTINVPLKSLHLEITLDSYAFGRQFSIFKFLGHK